MSSLAPLLIVNVLLFVCLFALASDPYNAEWNLSSSFEKAWEKRGTLLLSIVIAMASGIVAYQSGKSSSVTQ